MVQRVRKLAVKLLMILCVVCCVIGVALAFTACSGDTRSVSSFTINADGELVVNYSDNTSENLGKVTADAPERSVVSAEIVDGELIIHYSDGTQENLGSVSGGSGAQGNGIKSITLSEDGKALVITLEDGTVLPEVEIPEFTCEHEGEYDIVELVPHKVAKDGDGDPILDEAGNPTYINGTYLKVYKDCGHSEIIYDVLHDEEMLEETTVPATCTENAYTTMKCPTCGYETEKVEIPDSALGHDLQIKGYIEAEGQTVCEDGGVAILQCSRCDYQTTQVSAPTGHHSMDWEMTQAPTYTTEGKLEGLCEICGNQVSVAMPALYELDEDGEIVRDEAGNPVINDAYTMEVTVEKVYCTDIGEETYTYVVPAYGEEGDEYVTPEQTFEVVVTVPAANHELNGKEVIADNLTEYSGQIWNGEEYVAFNGYAIDVATLIACGGGEYLGYESSCDGQIAGMGYYTCEACDQLQPIYTYMEHSYTTLTDSKAATCTEAGTEEFDCDVCGDHVTYTGDKEAADASLEDAIYYDADLAPLGHAWTWTLVDLDANKEDDVHNWQLNGGKCSRCGEAASEENGGIITNIDNVTHLEDQDVASTCDEAGYEVWTYTDTDPESPTYNQTVTAHLPLPLASHTITTAAGNKLITELQRESDGRVDYRVGGITEYLGYESSCDPDASTAEPNAPLQEGEVRAYGRGYYTCPVCEEAQPVETYRSHNIDQITVTTQPTCTENGVGTGTCSDCEWSGTIEGTAAADYDELKALGHDVDYTLEENTATVTPENDFYLHVSCSRCELKDQDLGDEYAEFGSTGKLVTGEKTGNVEAGDCGDAEHNYTMVEYKVTVEETEEVLTIWVRTDRVYHTFNGEQVMWDLTVEDGAPATAIDITKVSGITEYVGYESSCATTASTELPVAPIPADDETTQRKYGMGYFECEACGEEQPVYTMRSHTYTDADITASTAATCTTDGSITYTCTTCDEEITETIAALGHTLTASVTKAPTQTEVGSVTVSCSVAGCEYSEVVELPALTDDGYTLDEDASYDATCTTEGLNVYTYDVEVTYQVNGTTDKTGKVTVTVREAVAKTAHTLVGEVETIFVEDQGLAYTGQYCEDCGNFIVAADGIESLEQEAEVSVGDKDYTVTGTWEAITNNDTDAGWTGNGTTTEIVLSEGEAVIFTWENTRDANYYDFWLEANFSKTAGAGQYIDYEPNRVWNAQWAEGTAPTAGEIVSDGTVPAAGQANVGLGTYKAVVAKVGSSIVMSVEFTAAGQTAGEEVVTWTQTVTWTGCPTTDAYVRIAGNSFWLDSICAYVGTLTEVTAPSTRA